MQHSFLYPSEDFNLTEGNTLLKKYKEAHEVRIGYRRCRESVQGIAAMGAAFQMHRVGNGMADPRDCSFSGDRNVGH